MPELHDPAPVALGAVGVTAAEWDLLALNSRNIFATREWLGTWQRHEPSTHGTFTLVSRRSDGRIAALLPLVVHRRRPTVLRPMGPWPPPEGPLMCAKEDEAWAVQDMARQLATRGRWDVLEMDAVPGEQAWRNTFRGVTFSREPTMIIDLAGQTWEGLLAAAKRNSRRDIRRRDRRLHERYSVRFRLAEDRSLHEDVDLFLGLHWARWGKDANVLTPHRASLIHDFAERAHARGWLALWIMELDGHAVAADLNFRFADREVAFMSGRDPAFRAEFVGLTLMFHTIRQAVTDGVREFHLLRGDQPFKARLPHRVGQVDHVALSGSLAGVLAIAARTARDRLRLVGRDCGLVRPVLGGPGRSSQQGGNPVERRTPTPDGV